MIQKEFIKIIIFLKKEYTKYFDNNKSIKADISKQNGIFICNNKNQIPVYYGVHIKKDIITQRFKKDNRNGIVIYSCEGNTYLTVKCERKS